MNKKKKSKLLLVSWILALAYVIYLISYFTQAIGGSAGGEQAGAALAGALVMPHFIVVLIATIFSFFGWLLSKKGFALVAGILFAVSIVLFPVYFMFVIVQMILSFIAYASMGKKQPEMIAE